MIPYVLVSSLSKTYQLYNLLKNGPDKKSIDRPGCTIVVVRSSRIGENLYRNLALKSDYDKKFISRICIVESDVSVKDFCKELKEENIFLVTGEGIKKLLETRIGGVENITVVVYGLPYTHGECIELVNIVNIGRKNGAVKGYLVYSPDDLASVDSETVEYVLENSLQPVCFSVLKQFMQRHNRKFGKNEVIMILKGRMDAEVRENMLHHVAGFGLMKDWHENELDEALEIMIKSGILINSKKGLWKYRLRIARGEFSWMNVLKSYLKNGRT